MLVVVSSVIGGCGQGGPSYLPLWEGNEWTYSTRTAFQNPASVIKVGPKVAVGSVEGRVLSGNFGESRMAWDGPRLIVSQLSNSRFSPPIPLFREDKIPDKKKQREQEFVNVDAWKGRVESFDQSRSATAILQQRRSQIDRNGRKVNVVESLLTITLGKSEIEIRTVFERGKGILRQEQRTNRNLVLSLDLLRSKS
jgi:hypothetical protein